MTLEAFNFRKPGRLASDLEQRLAAWLRDGCALAADRWAKHMALRVELALQGLEIVRPADGLARLPEVAVSHRLGLTGDGLTTLLTFPRPLALVLVGGMLGDPGEQLPADRELTVIEESLLEYVVQNLLVPLLRETWPGLETLAIELRQKEPNPKFTRIFPPDQNVVVCAFTARGSFGEQPWFWMLPQKGLLEHFGKHPGQDSPQAAETRPRLEAVVRDLPVEVSVALGSVELPLSHLARLRPGDLILLNQRVGDPLAACVGGEKKFRVWPGRAGSRQAFRVDSLIES